MHLVKIHASPERVYQALTTAEGIRNIARGRRQVNETWKRNPHLTRSLSEGSTFQEEEEERFTSLQEVLPRLDHYLLLRLGFEPFPPTLPEGDAWR